MSSSMTPQDVSFAMLNPFNKKKTVDDLCHSLRNNPSDWSWSDSNRNTTVRYKDTRLNLWVYCNEAYVYEPQRIRFSWWQERRLRRAFKYWLKKVGNNQRWLAQERALKDTNSLLHS